VPIEGSEFRIKADSIILAVGQRPDIAFLDGSGAWVHRNGTIGIDSGTGRTGAGCVYAGGDAVRGPATIVEACADGRRAAEAICAQFDIPCRPLSAGPEKLSDADILQVKRTRARRESRQKAEPLSVAERSGFDLVERTLTEQAARAEAARCLQCATLCEKCVEVCPNRANYSYAVHPTHLSLPRFVCHPGKSGRSTAAPRDAPDPNRAEEDLPGLAIAGKEPFQVEQTRQIVHIDDFCNECGNCATFCVHHGKPYTEKPRLFLHRHEFEQEDDNAFYIQGSAIRRREGGQESCLSVQDGTLTFENACARITLTPDFRVIDTVLKRTFVGTISLREAAEMTLILEGVTSSLPFLVDPRSA
jgi:putative selenate reductase